MSANLERQQYPLPSPPPSPPPPPLPATSPPHSPSLGRHSPTHLQQSTYTDTSPPDTDALLELPTKTYQSSTGYLNDKIGHYSQFSTTTIGVDGHHDWSRQISYSTELEGQNSDSVFRQDSHQHHKTREASSDTSSTTSYDSDESSVSSDVEKARDRNFRIDSYEVNSSLQDSSDEDQIIDSNNRKGSIKINDTIIHTHHESHPAKMKDIKKKKRRGEKHIVTKYKDNVKTVRQQIKPGTVEDLATLFTGWNNDTGTPPLSPQLSVDTQHEEKPHSESRLDFITASKLIQEKIILSRNNSFKIDLTEINANGSSDNNGQETISMKGDNNSIILKSAQTKSILNNGGVHSVNVETMDTSCNIDKLSPEHGETMDKNITVDRHLDNEYRGVEKRKHSFSNEDNSISEAMVMTHEGGKHNSTNVSKSFNEDKGKINNDELETRLNKLLMTKSNLISTTPDKTALSENTQAVAIQTYTQHSNTTKYYNDSNDLDISPHSRGISKQNGFLNDELETSFNANNIQDIKHTYDYVVDIDQQRQDMESKGDSFTPSYKPGIITSIKLIESEEKVVQNGRESESDRHNLSGSLSGWTSSDKDTDGHSLKDLDTWITTDSASSSFKRVSRNADDKTLDGELNNMKDLDKTMGISGVGIIVPRDNDKNSFTSEKTLSEYYITQNVDGPVVSKKEKDFFVKTEGPGQTELSANVNAQLLNNVQSQTREESRPDLFAHSTRVWSGRRDEDDDVDDDDDGGGEGGKRKREGRDGAATGDTQTNKRPVTLQSPLQPLSEEQNSERNGETFTSVDFVKENGTISDDFLSILDDIKIDTDVTSRFVKNKSRFSTSGKHSISSNDSDSDITDRVIVSNNLDQVGSMKKEKKVNKSVDKSVSSKVVKVSGIQSQASYSETKNLSFERDCNHNLPEQPKSDFDKEIEQLHTSLSSKTPVTPKDKNYNTNLNDSFNSSLQNDEYLNKENNRETSFNVDFFQTSSVNKVTGELETSRNEITTSFLTEVDQTPKPTVTASGDAIFSHSHTIPKTNVKVSTSRQSSVSESHSSSNEIPENESEQGSIISSRESFRSIRDQFERETKDSAHRRTTSFKNRRSLNLERTSSEKIKHWRKSGGDFSSWTVNAVFEDTQQNNSVNISQSKLASDNQIPVVINDDIPKDLLSSNDPGRRNVIQKEETITSYVENVERSFSRNPDSRPSVEIQDTIVSPSEIPVSFIPDETDNVPVIVDTLSNTTKSNIVKRQETNTLQRTNSASEDTSKDGKMTAVVGKVSSFNIHRRHDESPNMSSNRSISHGSDGSDVYLVQDKTGDVYAVQEVNTSQPALHTFEGDNYRSFDTSVSHQSFNHSINDKPRDMYVDGSNINDSKAREVITAYLQSSDNNNSMNRGQTITTSQFHSQSLNGRDYGTAGGNVLLNNSSFTTNPHSIVVHQDGGHEGYVGSNSVNKGGHGFDNRSLTNSTITVDTQVNTKEDSSQTCSSSHHEPYTTGNGGENNYRSSLVVTKFNTPHAHSTYSNNHSMDTSIDSLRHSIPIHQPLALNINSNQQNVTPFRTQPVTVQTTTNAIVGEKVDMKIDFPYGGPPPSVTTTAQLANSSSDDDNKKHYVIKSVKPKKSSLKKHSEFDTSLDSNSDITYTKREITTGDIVIGGKRSTVIDNRSDTDHTSKTYVINNNSLGRTKGKHHSPERFFKNAQLSLRRDNSSSEDDARGKQYRTVTRVVLDSDNVDSAKKSSQFEDNSFSEEDQYYELDTRGRRKRYKVINTSQNIIDSESVRAHSSPKPYKNHSQSYEEIIMSKSEKHTTPSQFQTLPSSSKRHKTVIQLDLDNSKARSESGFSDSSPRLWRTKSVDSLGGSNFRVVNTNDSRSSRSLWRTGRARSVGSSSDDSNSDLEGSGPYNMTPTLVNTSKQKRGNKTYVVKETVDDHHTHPPGWFRSTIDINEKAPERYHEQNYVIKNSDTSNHSFSQSEIITQQRTDTLYQVRSQQPTYTQIPIQASPDSGRGTEMFSSDGETAESRRKYERVERIYEVSTEPELPEQFLDTSVSSDMRVLRGKILIQNRMDESSHMEDDLDENVNVFDNSFHMGKDNPLYASDSDLMAALQREEELEMSKHVTQDITYDQVDSMSKKYKTTAGAELASRPKRKKQNLSTLLLSKLANVDSKDIRQTINVEHHNEEIVGDISFIHADGKKSKSQNTSNFDSVTENVELTLQQGKAYVIIKVIAERIIPTDLEFNIWRKSQAIVTRQIEIDLLANDQRRRFYHHVMDTRGRPSIDGVDSGSRGDVRGERELNSVETLKLFSQILDIADGQGDKDHTTMRTKQEMGQLNASADLLY